MMRAMRLPALLLLLLTFTGSVAHAQAPTAATPTPTTPTTSAPSDKDLNFDLFGDQKQRSPLDVAREKDRIAKLEREVRLRRTLLKWHQALGFVTLGALAATDIIGQLNYMDKYGGGNDTGTYYNAHLGLGIATTAVFATTGTLALAAPNPYPKPIKFDAALVHKVSMALAAAAFVTQIILGPITWSREGKLDQRDLATTHLVVGYAAFGFMAAGTLSYVF
jgi:hypothetical protein